MRLTTQMLKKAASRMYQGKGEEFTYWKKYLTWEKIKNHTGPDVWRPLTGWQMRSHLPWYYDDSPPASQQALKNQFVKAREMPVVQPIEEQEIFLGDRRWTSTMSRQGIAVEEGVLMGIGNSLLDMTIITDKKFLKRFDLQVEVMVGRDKGKIGEIIELIKERNWCFVEGLHQEHQVNQMVGSLRHIPSHIQILTRERPLLITHEVKLIDPADQKPTDIVWRYTEDGTRVRVSERSGRIIPVPPAHLNKWDDYTDARKYKAGSKDVAESVLLKVTYEPNKCSFEEDICESMGIEHKPRKKKGYFY